MTVIATKPTCFYHPVKVLFLDDNRAFLDAIDLEFYEKLNLLTLTDPDKAFNLIHKEGETAAPSLFKRMNDVDSDAAHDHIISFNISDILNRLYDKERFDQAPVLVVDYQMPTLDGIEFCKKLKDKKILKIMLTAEADTDTAITAFNHGLIDKFILKTSKNLYPELTSAVNDLTHRYFRELTKNIVTAYENTINDLFDNELYQQLFARVLSQTQAVEYYLVDNSGSILFLDKDAKPTWLIIRSAKELSDQSDLMQGYELPEQTMAAVAKKEKILFLLSEKEYRKPTSEWTRYLVDAKKLDSQYYYSITQDHLTDAIDWENVASYASYLADR